MQEEQKTADSGETFSFWDPLCYYCLKNELGSVWFHGNKKHFSETLVSLMSIIFSNVIATRSEFFCLFVLRVVAACVLVMKR